MPGADFSILGDTKLDASGFSAGLGKLGSLAKVGMTAVAGMAAAIGGAAYAGVQYNAGIETLTTSFAVMTGSAESAAKILGELKKYGKESPYDTEGLAKTAQTLMQYGQTGEAAVKITKMLGDVSQGSSEKMQSIAMAYGQMSSAGKVNMQDIKQMINAGFNPLQVISKKTGESMASLQDRMDKGKISVEELGKAFKYATEKGGQFYGSTEAQGKTFAGQMSTLKEGVSELLGTITKGMSENLAGSVLPMVNGWLGELTDAFETGGVDGLMEVGTRIVGTIITGIVEQSPMMASSALTIIQAILTGIQANVPAIAQGASALLTTLIMGLVQMAPMLISTGVTIIQALIGGLRQNLPDIISGGIDIVLALVAGVTQLAPDLMALGVDIILWILDQVISHLPEIVNAGKQLVLALDNGVAAMRQRILDFAYEWITTARDAVASKLGEIYNAGVRIVSELVGGVKSKIDAFIGQVNDLIKRAKDAFTNTDWASLGKNIIDGIISGIGGAAGRLFGSLRDLATSALESARGALRINSPSKVFRDKVGKAIPEGMADGIGLGIPALEQKMRDAALAMQSKFAMPVTSARPAFAVAGAASGDAPNVTLNQTINTARALSPSEMTAEAEDFLGRAKWGLK